MRGLLLLALALAVSTGGATAESVRATPVAVAFWSGSAGIGVFGLRGAVPPMALEVTADGGRSWNVTRRGTFSFTAAVTPGSHVAWAAGGFVPCPHPAGPVCYPHLLRSLDGGHRWSGTHVVADDVTFVTRKVGRASSSDEPALLVTGDGGSTWHRAENPCGRFSPHISFVSVRAGWLLCTGQPGAGSQEKRLLFTRNGGHTWHVLDSSRSPGYANGMLFVSPRRGWIWQSRAQTLQTDDGGRSWHASGLTTVERTEVRWMTAAGGTVWMLFGDSSGNTKLRRSSDQGTTWHDVG